MAVLLLGTTVACSLGQMLVGEPTPTPLPPAPPPAPTWTPSPVGQLSPAQIATLTVEAAVNLPTFTPTPTPIETPTPTPTFTPPVPPTETPTPTPAPYIVVVAPIVNVRQGPSVAYPIIGQVNKDEEYTLVGRNESQSWWQICCVDGYQVWITSQLTAPGGPVDNVPIAFAPELPPTPLPTSTPVPAETPTPPGPSWRFWVSEGPEQWMTTNPWLTIWVKAYVGNYPDPVAVPGYRMKVLRNGVDVSKPDLTSYNFQWSAPFLDDDPNAFGNRRQYNLKYEYLPDAGDADWTIYLVDGGGNPVSQEAKFTTRAGQPDNEIYISWFDAAG
ncbi:MAG: hypothetical protein R2844_05035 [Caldilineales bacterium]